MYVLLVTGRNKMTKLQLLIILPTFLLSNLVWANSVEPLVDNNSLSKAMLEIAARDYQAETAPEIKTAPSSSSYTHERRVNSSFFHAVLVKQGVKENLIINSESKVDYSRNITTSERNNSLFKGALAK